MTGPAQHGAFQSLAKETRVAVAVDWHGSALWLQTIIPAIHHSAPDIRTILHVGDFGIYPDRRGKGFLNAIDRSCLATGIHRVLVTPGNHDHWPRLDQRFEHRPGQPAQLSKTVWPSRVGHHGSNRSSTKIRWTGIPKLWRTRPYPAHGSLKSGQACDLRSSPTGTSTSLIL